MIVRITDPRLSGLEAWTSLEGENPGGSIKDHMVRGALEAMIAEGRFARGEIVVEASAGSTASSLAHYCRELGVRCALFVPETLPEDARAALRAQGADVHAVPTDASGWRAFQEFSARPGVIAFNQHSDTGKRVHYHALGEKVSRELGAIDVLIGAVGTSHSLLGVAEAMRPRPRVITAEPRSIAVPGIRNIDRERHGHDDPCVPALFDERVLLEAEEFFRHDRLATSAGEIVFPDSFRVALGALARCAPRMPGKRFFVLGAANRRLSRRSV